MYKVKVPKHCYFFIFVYFFICLDFNAAQVKVPLNKRPAQKPTTRCSEYQFTCENKLKCLEFVNLCDDVNDCLDGSDEKQFCHDLRKDKSRCILPPETRDKSYTLNCKNGISSYRKVKSDGIPFYTTITLACHPGYTREEGSNIFKSYCLNGTWSPPIQDCKKICKRLFPSNMNLECYRDGKSVECDGPLLSGTTVKASCKYQYKLRSPVNYETIKCDENGQWSNPLPECVVECGKIQENVSAIQMIGNPNNYNNFPWHAAIYDIRNAPTLICSGTIISPLLILTAITCVLDKMSSEKLKPRHLQVVTSKVTPNYFIQDNEFQKSYEVVQIHSEKIDLVILELSEKIAFSYAVFPACVGTDYKTEQESLSYAPYTSRAGTVASWGITNVNSIDENTFRVDEYESKSYEDCTDEEDKFCGRLTYGAGTNLSDTGAGFMYKHTDNKQYVIGVMNTKYRYKNNYVIICTNLEVHYDKWVDVIWQTTENQKLLQEIKNNFRTRTECEYESSFDVQREKASVCLRENIFPIVPPCKRICNRIRPLPRMTLNCTYNNLPIDCQDDLVEGTKVTIECHDGYKPLNNPDYREIVCQKDGTWSNELFTCVSSSLKQCSLPSRTNDKTYIIDCKKDSESSTDLENIFVEELTMLTFQCKPGYFRQEGNSFQAMCLNGTWTPKVDLCTPFCKTFQSMNLKPECHYEGVKIDCNQPLPAGTRLRPLCEKYYHKKYVAGYEEELICKENGYWDAIPIECIQPCGNNIKDDSEYFYNYEDIRFQVSIVDKTTQLPICAGTQITSYLILTNARCFYNLKTKGVNPASNYEIITGKRVIPLSSSLQANVLKLTNYRRTYQVRNIFYTNKGRNKIIANYTEDLALLETEEKIQINTNTIAACVNWHSTNEFDIGLFDENIGGYQPGKIGKWGKDFFQQDGSYLGTETSLSTYFHRTYDTCKTYTSNKKESKADMMCMERTNNTHFLNDVDYGTGYFQLKGDYELYHVQGVFSAKTSNPEYILMINVNHHMAWIRRINDYIEKRKLLLETKNNFQILHYGCMENIKCETDLSQIFTYQAYVAFCEGNVTKRQYVGGCNLPISNEYNIKYEVWCPSNDFTSNCNSAKENFPVPELTKLTYTCKPGYAIESNEEQETFCHSRWIPAITPCRRVCKKLKPVNVMLKCALEGKPVDCHGNLVENTKVVPTCLPEYEPEYNPGYHELRCLADGEWSGVLFSCRPKCGRSAVKNVTTLIRGGYEAAFGEFPWHVAIFDRTAPNKPTLICGGTIISPYAIVSAAHCFFDRVKKVTQPAEHYDIGVGKISNDYNAKDSEVTKIYEVEKIIIENFLGITLRYQYDIAILQIKNKIEFNAQVVPICMHHSPTIIPSGEILKACGWGVDNTDLPSTKLRSTRLPYLSVSECSKRAPENIIDYISVDKFCVGNVNGSLVDKGDSGGGLALMDKVSSLHYLVGIVSFKAVDLPSVAIITDVNQHYYLNWISKHLNEIHRMKQYDVVVEINN